MFWQDGLSTNFRLISRHVTPNRFGYLRRSLMAVSIRIDLQRALVSLINLSDHPLIIRICAPQLHCRNRNTLQVSIQLIQFTLLTNGELASVDKCPLIVLQIPVRRLPSPCQFKGKPNLGLNGSAVACENKATLCATEGSTHYRVCDSFRALTNAGTASGIANCCGSCRPGHPSQYQVDGVADPGVWV